MPGLSVRPNRSGFVAVDLCMEADPVALTPEVIQAAADLYGGRSSWRFRKEYLKEWDAQKGASVFDEAWLAQVFRIEPPLYEMEYDAALGEMVKSPRGRLWVWRAPDARPPDALDGVEYTPRQCGIGVDVGEGVGQSDSTIEVFFADTGEQVAEFASNTTKPADLGRIAAAVGRHFNAALVCCVRKMHGITVIRTMVDECGYPNMWRHAKVDRTTEYATDALGWHKGESSDELLFGRWMDAIQHGRVLVHGDTCLKQHQSYIYNDRGRITYGPLSDMPVEVRERHGDLVIACALAYRACLDVPRFVDMIPVENLNPRTFEGRRNLDVEFRLRMDEDDGWN